MQLVGPSLGGISSLTRLDSFSLSVCLCVYVLQGQERLDCDFSTQEVIMLIGIITEGPKKSIFIGKDPLLFLFTLEISWLFPLKDTPLF